MKYAQKDNSGSLFRNTDKKNERGPDYSGTASIDGKEFFMDAWLKESENGRKWMSFAFKPKQVKPATSRRDESDDAPF